METKKQARPRFVATHSSSSSSAEITPDSSSSPPSPPSTDPRSNENLDVGGPAPVNKRDSTHGLDQSSIEAPPPKTKSVLNLTSSTLSGIYSPTGYDANRDDSATPWGTGTQTPARSSSIDAKLKSWKSSGGTALSTSGDERKRRYSRRRSYQHPLPNHGVKQRSSYYTRIMFRTTILFVLGIAYGDVVLHLHDTNKVAPVRIENINRSSRWYLAFWGLSSVILGTLVPWLDQVSNNRKRDASEYDYDPQEEKAKENEEFEDSDTDGDGGDRNRNSLGAEWNPIVRSIGAFVGIAFAIFLMPRLYLIPRKGAFSSLA
ncbi:MAG: hypothetical protein M1831_004836 [Alyxoria varia]|nr:MAG: hypothetical protein M1831_004836 [Alyxoria varia]